MHSPPPGEFLSGLNILYPLIETLVSETKNISKIELIMDFKDSDLFLKELMFK